MKEDDFNKLLNNLPDYKPRSELRKRLMDLNNQKRGRSVIPLWVSIAASIAFFFLGYGVATYQSIHKQEQLYKIALEMRTNLLSGLIDGEDANLQATSIKLLSQVGSKDYQNELMAIYLEVNDVNLKLAILEELSPFHSSREVITFLREQLEVEKSPLVIIPIINLINKHNASIGKATLEQLLKNKHSLHPAVLEHLKTL